MLKLCRGVLRSLDAEEQQIYLTLAKKISGNAAQQFGAHGESKSP